MSENMKDKETNSQNINIQEPTWYNTKEDFNLISINNNINNIMIYISNKT